MCSEYMYRNKLFKISDYLEFRANSAKYKKSVKSVQPNNSIILTALLKDKNLVLNA